MRTIENIKSVYCRWVQMLNGGGTEAGQVLSITGTVAWAILSLVTGLTMAEEWKGAYSPLVGLGTLVGIVTLPFSSAAAIGLAWDILSLPVRALGWALPYLRGMVQARQDDSVFLGKIECGKRGEPFPTAVIDEAVIGEMGREFVRDALGRNLRDGEEVKLIARASASNRWYALYLAQSLETESRNGRTCHRARQCVIALEVEHDAVGGIAWPTVFFTKRKDPGGENEEKIVWNTVCRVAGIEISEDLSTPEMPVVPEPSTPCAPVRAAAMA